MYVLLNICNVHLLIIIDNKMGTHNAFKIYVSTNLCIFVVRCPDCCIVLHIVIMVIT